MIRGLIIASTLGFIILTVKLPAQDLNSLRNDFKEAATDKKVCQSMIKDLKGRHLSNVEWAYLGTLETIWAKYSPNPFSKLSTFNKGKEKMEQAVKKDSTNLEIRYLRLSIQKNVPGFLGYDKNIAQDERFLKNNLLKVHSSQLKKWIRDLLNDCGGKN